MSIPLAENLRPSTFADVAGQDHLLREDGLILRSIAKNHPLSLLLWGPPGCGKTTLARLYAKSFDIPFVTLSAVFNGVADLKKIIKEHIRIIIFVDEIHRFNKAQQDAFLPFVENGSVTLIGATTENPSFALNNALLSRLRVLTLNPLEPQHLETILSRYESNHTPIPKEKRQELIQLSQGDGRYLLNLVENLSEIDSPQLSDLARPPLYDRHDDQHYNLISALHKSVRGSDPDAALYWLARMLVGGEDPNYIARRIMRMATEDIGLSDPHALSICLAAWQTFERLGSPEGELALAEAIVYLALAPKSNAIYTAFKEAQSVARKTSHLSPPKTILNAPTSFMKSQGYGKDYAYDHDTTHGFSGQNYFPNERHSFYSPVERGFERELKKRLNYFLRLKKTLK